MAFSGFNVEVFRLPVPTGLSGVDLLMSDLKALEAYGAYFYYLSKTWSKPLPEVYDAQRVADYFNCRPHVVAFRLVEVAKLLERYLLFNFTSVFSFRNVELLCMIELGNCFLN